MLLYPSPGMVLYARKTIIRTNGTAGRKNQYTIVSIYRDSEVESIPKILCVHDGTLAFYYVAASSTLQPLRESYFFSVGATFTSLKLLAQNIASATEVQSNADACR